MKTKYFEELKLKLIYVFRINDSTHRDCLKIGEATMDVDPDEVDITSIAPNSKVLNKAARNRIDQYTATAGIAYELLYTESASYRKGSRTIGFNDKDVHEVLKRSGIQRKEFHNIDKGGKEWFITDLETAKRAIAAIKEGRESLNPCEISIGRSPIEFRPEQTKAITKTVKLYKKAGEKSRRMLWNAKMRFGKTLSALQVAKEMQFSRTLILTHRPVVDAGWFEDFDKIFYDSPGYAYGSKNHGSSFVGLENRHKREGLKYVFFASMQDLRGSETVGGKFDKNDDIFSTPWDYIIIDEAHEGTQTALGKTVIAELTKESTKILQLSGTPFNLMDDATEEEMFTWDYTMEQRAKQEWDQNHFGDPNPYAGLPRMNIYTYDLGRLLRDFADEDIAFNFKEFFRTNDNGEFLHHADVLRFLNLLTKEDPESMYPFANVKYRSIFRHTLWMVPGVKAAKALSAMLKEHPVFGNFDIVNVAGDGDEEEDREEALKKVNKAISEAQHGTITLSCGRLTTGVSVPQWMGVLMLSGSFNTAASAYMQTIFRVQTPYSINGLVKEDCYVFDFAPDRTLQVLASVPRVSHKAGKTTDAQREALGDFLNFCPVIGMEGSMMKPYDANKMMEQLKKAYVERVVRNGFEDGYLYTDKLLKLDEVAVKDFKELKGIIGQTKAIGNSGNIDVNAQGLTNEEYEEKEKLEKKKKKELTDEEKARLEELKKKKKLKEDAVSILRGISIRMPLLIYGARIDNEDEQLTIDNFTSLVDAQSWEEFMPRGVTKVTFNKFKRYYDPDIFAAAGKRIRAMARAADRLTIEERIERITDIFSTFRNPDKETVLTPWRVVNMHMSDTLGGYTFFNEDFSETITEPRYVEHHKVTDEVFAPGSHLLEINSKSGLYPLYLAYNLHRRVCKDAMFSPQTLDEHLVIWDKVVSESVFVICKTPMAKAITRRTLMGFRKGAVNMWAPEDLINKIKNQPELFIKKVHDLVGKDVKINAIVGNPPYQEVVAQKETANGQKRSSSIFQYFQTISDRLGRYTSLIYPGARWIHRSGKGLEQFGLSQINDPHLCLLKFFPDSTDVFKEVGIADGLSIVMKDTHKESNGFKYIYSKNGKDITVYADNPKEDLFPLNPLDNEIVSCLDVIIGKYNTLHESVLSQKLFSIESDFVERNPTLVREYNEGDYFDPELEIKLFTNDKAGKSGRARWYVASKDVITTGLEHLNRWKVIVSSANAGGQKRSNQIAIVDNHSAFGRSRVALKTFATEQEAKNFFRYATSEIIRFAFLLTDESLTSLAKKVPDLLDYSGANGIIDYNGDVNAQLYELFGIDDKNQQHIREVLASKE
ncbi:Eco57I restriction-modification methylase domain-containing protein [Bacteroides uniformis]|uniref:Eco57I restriction-modification methylase domain-containing protein n=2 Tax=Bacteroides TaxID=816 RepID=UPI00202F5C51|nr:Eco57I restriction-modification methylase domain-containing protein [Bacteroides uniformis]MCM1630161.1 Eco57I restriction-modification methylase domain-containing protein [Bacteroides uniformis]MCM1633620.1 Eco57I restriction-modification methylase domain-containing protein [Bacteroides uniformis]MCM1667588.1 Eco57I restriction-modification methylase domain-containing protein [Bacteroides uniformis]MCM1703838.1 Eco57I restriction-modification methylase domain-containing protein [Bacteroides